MITCMAYGHESSELDLTRNVIFFEASRKKGERVSGELRVYGRE